MNISIKTTLFLLCILFGSMGCYAQDNDIIDAAYTDFNNLVEAFLELSIDPERNNEIYDQLEELQDIISKVHVSQEERYKLNSLKADINTVTMFMAPISNKFNMHLSDSNIERLQTIFGHNFTKTKLNVKCPKDEIEFIEVNVGSLVICYLHCISKKAIRGLRIKYYAKSGNSSNTGEYGAMINEYTPLLHNAGENYMRINSAKITKRF